MFSYATRNCPWPVLLQTDCYLFSVFSVPRYIFLFDKVVIVCKRKNYNYELKEIIELHLYKMSDDPMNNRDMKKVRGLWFASHRAWFRINKLAFYCFFQIDSANDLYVLRVNRAKANGTIWSFAWWIAQMDCVHYTFVLEC